MIAHASGYNTAAPEIAAETGVAVATVDRPESMVPGLVADYTLHGHGGAYLAGQLAALMTRTGTVGIVVSGEPPSWNSQSAGFALGVAATDAEDRHRLRGHRTGRLWRRRRRPARDRIGDRRRRGCHLRPGQRLQLRA